MNLHIAADQLEIELEWHEQFWAFHFGKTIDIPLSHITHVTTDDPQSSWAELRAPGTCLPGVIKAGTYYTRLGREFWYVTAETNYLTLELRDEYYKRVVVTSANSQTWADQLHPRLQS